MKNRYELNEEKRGAGRGQWMKTWALALVVVCVHVVAIGGFFAIQGCGTVQREPRVVEPAPAPVMPPKAPMAQQQRTAPRRAIRPPVPVEPAPPMRDHRQVENVYVVQKGDSLSRIAQRFDVSTKELCELNGIKNPNRVRVGQKLTLPAYAKKGVPPPSAPKQAPARPQSRAVVSSSGAGAPLSGDQYVVQPGDVLSRIAVKYGTTVKELREANKLSGDKIIVGQKLIIPKGASASSAKVAAPAVAEKPAPSAPAVKPSEPVKSTPVPTEKETIIAEEIQVESAPAAASPASPKEAYYYKVIDGDTPETIARMFTLSAEEILRANSLPADAQLKPGQHLLIPFTP